MALSRSGPRKRAVRCSEPSLLSTMPGADQPRPRQPVGRAPSGRLRYSARSQHRIQQHAVLRGGGRAPERTADRTRAPHRQRVAGEPEQVRPGSHSCRPSPTAAASVPLPMATVRGAPPSRIGSVSERCSGTWKPSIATSRATGEAEEGQEERRGGKGDRQPEHDLDQAAESRRWYHRRPATDP